LAEFPDQLHLGVDSVHLLFVPLEGGVEVGCGLIGWGAGEFGGGGKGDVGGWSWDGNDADVDVFDAVIEDGCDVVPYRHLNTVGEEMTHDGFRTGVLASVANFADEDVLDGSVAKGAEGAGGAAGEVMGWVVWASVASRAYAVGGDDLTKGA
jgi:hypothetical protein